MRKTVRLLATQGPEARLAAAIGSLPTPAQRALSAVAERDDLPLVAGSWATDQGGCLVANVVSSLGAQGGATAEDGADLTLDLRVLELIPEMSSRDLNRIIIAWDEAAAQEDRYTDAALRRLLRNALACAGVAPYGVDPTAGEGSAEGSMWTDGRVTTGARSGVR